MQPNANINSRQTISAELVHLLYSQANPAIMGSLLVATCLLYALYNVVSNQVVMSWYGLMLAISLARISIVKLYLKNPPTSLEDTKFWRRLFIAMAACAGASWSLATILLILAGTEDQIFIACAFASVSAGAVPFYAGNRAACAVFITPILLPFSVWLLIQPNSSHPILGLLALLYLGLLLISSLRTHKVIYNAVKLKFENQELVNNLSAAKKSMLEEINERELAEKLLKESEEQYRLVTDALPVLIAYIDNTLHFRYNNKVYESWYQKPLTEITGKSIKEIVGDNAFVTFNENYQKVLATNKQVTFETILHMNNENERYASVTLIPHMRNGKLDGIFSLMGDMTPRINYLATHDSLTDLPNRSLFNARFSHSLERAHAYQKKIALFFLDLDHFKNINDTLGHDLGDQLLIKVTERIKKHLRDEDTLARLGGDEFTILLYDVSPEEIIVIAKRVCDAFSLPFHLGAHEVFITTSIGISIYPDDGSDMQILLKNADIAIYRAKEQGRNTFVFYTAEMNNNIIRKSSIEMCLRSALEKKELSILYQPIINVLENTVSSFEGLLRWNHPAFGLVKPIEFIPIAEESGLIVPIGEWVFRQACFECLALLKMKNVPEKMRFSINISARQFREQNLVDSFIDILKETGLSAESLTLELTESLIMHDICHSLKIIQEFKNLGMAISIDDFGTGYSSLNYLRRFPIDIIKIDRSFITDLTKNPEDASIVKAIIAMAHSLKMKVVAEGVETLEQYDFLAEWQCDELQGHLISLPLAFVDIDTFLQNPIVTAQRANQRVKKPVVVKATHE
ncbi:MAG: EAL domain-containing protein [Gammaproteobacteria bacterium]